MRVCPRRRIQTVWWRVEHGGVKCVSRSREGGTRLIQQDCVPGASHQERSQTERISSATRSKRMSCTAARNVSLACIEVPSKKRIRRRRVWRWRQRRVRRGVVCGEWCERVRRGVCVARTTDGPGFGEFAVCDKAW